MTKLEDKFRADQFRGHAKQYRAFGKIWKFQGREAFSKVAIGLAEICELMAETLEDEEFMKEV